MKCMFAEYIVLYFYTKKDYLSNPDVDSNKTKGLFLGHTRKTGEPQERTHVPDSTLIG